mgnify:CR=1 FL=1
MMIVNDDYGTLTVGGWFGDLECTGFVSIDWSTDHARQGKVTL